MPVLIIVTLQCTIGYGDVYATNDAERMFMCCVLLLTAMCYAVIFGNVTVQLQEIDRV